MNKCSHASTSLPNSTFHSSKWIIVSAMKNYASILQKKRKVIGKEIYMYRPGQPNWEFWYGYSTVWKFSNFSITLNLREIQFWGLKKCKIYHFWSYLEALNYDFYVFLHFVKYEIGQKFIIQSLQNWKMAFLELLDHPKLISRKIKVTIQCKYF